MKKSELRQIIQEEVSRIVLNEDSGDSEEFVRKYPELDDIAKKVAHLVTNEIKTRVQNVESEMTYKAQYVLEELIKILEQRV